MKNATQQNQGPAPLPNFPTAGSAPTPPLSAAPKTPPAPLMEQLAADGYTDQANTPETNAAAPHGAQAQTLTNVPAQQEVAREAQAAAGSGIIPGALDVPVFTPPALGINSGVASTPNTDQGQAPTHQVNTFAIADKPDDHGVFAYDPGKITEGHRNVMLPADFPNSPDFFVTLPKTSEAPTPAAHTTKAGHYNAKGKPSPLNYAALLTPDLDSGRKLGVCLKHLPEQFVYLDLDRKKGKNYHFENMIEAEALTRPHLFMWTSTGGKGTHILVRGERKSGGPLGDMRELGRREMYQTGDGHYMAVGFPKPETIQHGGTTGEDQDFIDWACALRSMFKREATHILAFDWVKAGLLGNQHPNTPDWFGAGYLLPALNERSDDDHAKAFATAVRVMADDLMPEAAKAEGISTVQAWIGAGKPDFADAWSKAGEVSEHLLDTEVTDTITWLGKGGEAVTAKVDTAISGRVPRSFNKAANAKGPGQWIFLAESDPRSVQLCNEAAVIASGQSVETGKLVNKLATAGTTGTHPGNANQSQYGLAMAIVKWCAANKLPPGIMPSLTGMAGVLWNAPVAQSGVGSSTGQSWLEALQRALVDDFGVSDGTALQTELVKAVSREQQDFYLGNWEWDGERWAKVGKHQQEQQTVATSKVVGMDRQPYDGGAVAPAAVVLPPLGEDCDPVQYMLNHPDNYGVREGAGIDMLMEAFNRYMAVVSIKGKTRVMRRVWTRVPKLHRENIVDEYQWGWEAAERQAVIDLYSGQNVFVPKDDGKGTTASNAIRHWVNSHAHRTHAQGIEFRPRPITEPVPAKPWGGLTGYSKLNLWNGFGVAPAPGCWDVVRSHIWEVFADSDPVLFKYILDWMAFGIQHPDKPTRSALVVRGEGGIGKGVLAAFYGSLWGNHWIALTDPDQLTNHFNAHMADKAFVFADEAFLASVQEAKKLNMMVSEPTMQVTLKGVDSDYLPNRRKFMVATNRDFILPIANDERRFCIFTASPKYKNNSEYFDQLFRAMDDPAVQAAALHELANRDISDFHPESIPDTESMRAHKEMSLDPQFKWLSEALTNGALPGVYVHTTAPTPDGNVWAGEIGVSGTDLRKSLKDWLMQNGYTFEAGKLPKQAVSATLKKALGNNGHWYTRRTNTGAVYMLPDLETCRALFTDNMNVGSDWS